MKSDSRLSATDLERLTDEVERVLVAGWRDESREAWQIAADIVNLILDKCSTVGNNVSNGATSSQTEKGQLMPVTATLTTDTGVSRTKTFNDITTAEQFLTAAMGTETAHGTIVEGVAVDTMTGEETYTEY